jgi:hypothetical protein
MHQGKLYRFEREADDNAELMLGFDPTVRKHYAGVQFYWLCENCAVSMTLIHCKGVV